MCPPKNWHILEATKLDVLACEVGLHDVWFMVMAISLTCVVNEPFSNNKISFKYILVFLEMALVEGHS